MIHRNALAGVEWLQVIESGHVQHSDGRASSLRLGKAKSLWREEGLAEG